MSNGLVQRSCRKFGEAKVDELDEETPAGQPRDPKVDGLKIPVKQISPQCGDPNFFLEGEFFDSAFPEKDSPVLSPSASTFSASRSSVAFL